MSDKRPANTLIDNSRLIIESLARAGADVFIGYPITPANLLYQYASRRFPIFRAAPDEITTLQLMSGFAAAGRLPITATSFPGYALMIESINMAAMMELPMVIILVQRLGPATGTATCGAQGDLTVVSGTISGGMALPVIGVSDTRDCWELPPRALEIAVALRTPVILLTSKEEVMTLASFDLRSLREIVPVDRPAYQGEGEYRPYAPDENRVPPFLPLTSRTHQVRITASTHDTRGILQNTTPEALANSRRLHEKVVRNLPRYTYYDLEESPDAKTILVAFGITARAAREAVGRLRAQGTPISVLVPKTLLPVPEEIYAILSRYERIVIAEENMTGQYAQILFGARLPHNVRGVHAFGRMIEPDEIIDGIKHPKPAVS